VNHQVAAGAHPTSKAGADGKGTIHTGIDISSGTHVFRKHSSAIAPVTLCRSPRCPTEPRCRSSVREDAVGVMEVLSFPLENANCGSVGSERTNDRSCHQLFIPQRSNACGRLRQVGAGCAKPEARAGSAATAKSWSMLARLAGEDSMRTVGIVTSSKYGFSVLRFT
jgi:hypothetical protein